MLPLRSLQDVDIETEWNLKDDGAGNMDHGGEVDIETEWNLKTTALRLLSAEVAVDIETEWNLKPGTLGGRRRVRRCRYRNRVEFKDILYGKGA